MRVRKTCAWCRGPFKKTRRKPGKYCSPACRAADWYKHDHNKDRQRDTILRRLYGITLLQYQQMEKEQGGGCAICGGKGKRRLAVDHCHATGKPRALLCDNCNTALGSLRDDPLLLRKAIEYLERWAGNHAGCV